MPVTLKRSYEPPAPGDGYRVLVDRLWPRGVARRELAIDEWPKELAPSDRLRKAFHRGELGWGEFRRRYLSELRAHRDTVRRLARLAGTGRVTLVFSARDEAHNNAVVLMQYMRMLGGARAT